MYSIRVATTDDRETPIADDWPGLTWERLCDVLRFEISPQAATLFAEPVADPTRGLTHWHIVASDDPEPVLALDPSARERLLRSFHALRDEIIACADRLAAEGGESKQRLAAGLRVAVRNIDPDTQLWSAAGVPLVTGWGRRKAVASVPDARITARTGATAEPERAGVASPRVAISGMSIPGRPVTAVHTHPGLAARVVDAGPAAAALTHPGARRVWPWLLWLLFAAITATIFYWLLAACTIIGLPGSGAGCTDRSGVVVSELAERNDALRRAIHEAQRRFALGTDCPRDATGTPPSQEEARIRAEEAQLARGRMDVTLAWTGREDLDLHIYCPGGHMFHNQLGACGGTLDRDRNRNNTTLEETPIEHAGWERDPPPGEYRIVVVFYGTNGEPPRPVPFTVLLREGDSERSFNGRVDAATKEVEATRFLR